MKPSLRLLGFAAMALAATAFASLAGYTFKRTVKEGEILKFRISAQLDMNGSPIRYSGLSQEKVVKVAEDGTYTVEQTTLESKVDDQPMTMKSGIITTIIKPGGVVQEVKGDEVGQADYRYANLTAFIEPGKELNDGDVWSHDFAADEKTGTLKAHADYKVLGSEKVGEVDAVKVKMDTKELEGDDKATIDATVWIDKANGSLVKMQSKWANVPFPGAPMPVTADVTISREN